MSDSPRLAELLETELEALGPQRYQITHQVAQSMRRAWSLGRSEALLGLMTLGEAAERAGVSRRRAQQLLGYLESRGLYSPIRVGSAVIVEDGFVESLKARRREAGQ